MTQQDAAAEYGISTGMAQAYENYLPATAEYTSDGKIAEYIKTLEEDFSAKEIESGVPEEARLAPLFAKELWGKLDIVAPKKSHVDEVKQRSNRDKRRAEAARE